MRGRLTLVCVGMAAVLLDGMAAEASRHNADDAPAADVRLAGDGLEQTVHCKHNALHVLGSNSRLTIEGSCTTVYVEGSRNFVEIQDTDVVDAKGEMNTVLMLSPRTRVVDRGRANSISQKWQQ